MNVQELYEHLNGTIPTALSCGWDNDGIMVTADFHRPVKGVLVALDATESAIRYAADHGFDVLLTHHPMIFKGAKHITPENPAGRRIVAALTNRVTVFSFHTRLDAVADGVNDALCRALGWEADGVFGDDEAPTLGRLVTLGEAMSLRALAAHVKACLDAPAVKLIAADPDRVISRVALCGGDGKSFTDPAMAEGAEVLITGNSSYNAAQDGAECGIATIEAGHFETEEPICAVLEEKIKALGIPCGRYCSRMEYVI